MNDEINDPIEKSFRVSFFGNIVFICRLGGGEFRGGGVFEGGRAGGNKSLGRFHCVCRGVLVAMVVGAA